MQYKNKVKEMTDQEIENDLKILRDVKLGIGDILKLIERNINLTKGLLLKVNPYLTVSEPEWYLAAAERKLRRDYCDIYIIIEDLTKEQRLRMESDE